MMSNQHESPMSSNRATGIHVLLDAEELDAIYGALFVLSGDTDYLAHKLRCYRKRLEEESCVSTPCGARPAEHRDGLRTSLGGPSGRPRRQDPRGGILA